MIPSSTSPDPFNGSHDMVSVSVSVDESAATCPSEVVLTARVAHGPAWSTIIVLPPFGEAPATGRDIR
jgi:hypothetical protein